MITTLFLVLISFLTLAVASVYLDLYLINSMNQIAGYFVPFGVTIKFDHTAVLWNLKINLVLLAVCIVFILIKIGIKISQSKGTKRSVSTCRKAVHLRS